MGVICGGEVLSAGCCVLSRCCVPGAEVLMEN